MKKVIIPTVLIIVCILVYSFFINPYQFKINEYTIYSSKITENFDGFKITHFSDVLLGSTTTMKEFEKIIEEIKETNPDIIIFTGDLFHQNYEVSRDEKRKIKDLLLSLNCNLYKYAIIGDNDKENLNLYKEIMSDANFQILDNTSTYLFYKDIDPILITGITDSENLQSAYKGEEGITPTLRITLTHYPDYFDSINPADTDLIFAGHSLGGQIRLPFFGGTIKKEGAKTYIDTFYEIEDSKMYVSNGLGTEKYPVRTMNTPSINIYRLVKGQK